MTVLSLPSKMSSIEPEVGVVNTSLMYVLVTTFGSASCCTLLDR